MSSVNAANKETVTLADESALPQQPTLSPALSPTTTATEPPASPETLDDLRHDDAIIITEPSSNGRSSDPEKMLDSAMDGDLPPDPIDPGNEPLILMNTVDGTEHMATRLWARFFALGDTYAEAFTNIAVGLDKAQSKLTFSALIKLFTPVP